MPKRMPKGNALAYFFKTKKRCECAHPNPAPHQIQSEKKDPIFKYQYLKKKMMTGLTPLFEIEGNLRASWDWRPTDLADGRGLRVGWS